MKVPDKKTQLLNEICNTAGLNDYRDTVNEILNEIHSSNCNISCRYDKVGSNIEQYLNHENPRIRISMVSIKEPLHVIWAILHEFGHFKSGKPNGEEPIDREMLAWEIAEKDLKRYPDLLKEKDSFYRHKDYCIATYLRGEEFKRVNGV